MEADRILNEELIKQYIVAGSTRTRSEKLRVLAEHFCDKIRMRVAENPSTPTNVLRNLAHDPSNDVRIAVATNKSCEDAVIKRLARDNDVIVRHGLAQNVDLPRAILEELADDENGWVRGEALKTLEIIDSDQVMKSDDSATLNERETRVWSLTSKSACVLIRTWQANSLHADCF